MTNLKIYKICHNLITYFVTLTSSKKSQLGPIFRTGGSINYEKEKIENLLKLMTDIDPVKFHAK